MIELPSPVSDLRQDDIPPDHEIDDAHQGEGYRLEGRCKNCINSRSRGWSFAKGGFTADHNAMATEILSMGSRLRRARSQNYKFAGN